MAEEISLEDNKIDDEDVGTKQDTERNLKKYTT